MPDFAMCANHSCPSSGSCRRFLAKAAEDQQFAEFRPAPGRDRCESYWQAEGA